MSPRKLKTLGALVLDVSGGAVSGNSLLVHSACLILPGSKSTDNDHQGFQGTGEPPMLLVNPDGETGTDNSLAPGGTPTTEGERPGRHDGIGS